MTAELNDALAGFPTGFEAAVGLIERGECTCAVFRDDEIIHTASGRGVSPLLSLMDAAPETLLGASVADKIIGKAAAMILCLCGAKAVYGHVMSEAGRDYLASRGIPCACGSLVRVVEGRNGTPMCPIERSVSATDDAVEGVALMRQTIAELMRGK